MKPPLKRFYMVKESICLETRVVYEVHCACGMFYIHVKGRLVATSFNLSKQRPQICDWRKLREYQLDWIFL